MTGPSGSPLVGRGDADRHAAVTRSLLGYGVLAGPFYLVVGLAQALTRDGYDLARHDLSLLANGPWGWIQIANLVVTGLMTIAAAVGIPLPIQLGVFAVASVVGVVLIRPVVRRHLERPSIHVFGPAAHAGKTARVVHEIHGESGRIRIDGEDWTARTYDEALVIPVGTVVDVLEINGVIALVYPKE